MLGVAITVESIAGTTIDRCLMDCITLANKLDCIVHIDINDTKTIVCPGDTLELTRATYDNFERLRMRDKRSTISRKRGKK